MDIQKKKTAYRGTLVGVQAAAKTETPLGTVCQMIYSLSAAFQEKPEVCEPQNSCELWVTFPQASVQCGDFFEDYGACLASLSPYWTVTLCGFSDYLEEGELGVAPCGEGFQCEKKNLSGRDFDILTAVWLRIRFGKKAEAEFAAKAARAMSPERGAAAVCCRWADVFDEKGLFEDTGMSYFRYLFFAEAEDPAAAMASCLSTEQMKELWTHFLRDRKDALEFELLYHKLEVISEAQRNRLMTALGLTLASQAIRVEHDCGGFRVTDAEGGRLWFDFGSRSAAEKLFLKLIFPVPEE